MGLTYPSNKICPRCGTGGYVWYLDNSEYVAKCTNCNHYFRREDFPMYVLDEAPKPITNADRIRAMTDEELAVWIAETSCCSDWCILRDACDKKQEHECCINVWLDWLREEVKRDGPGSADDR